MKALKIVFLLVSVTVLVSSCGSSTTTTAAAAVNLPGAVQVL